MKKLRICNIGWATSIHVERWLKWFAARGHEIFLITDVAKNIKGVKVIKVDDRPTDKKRFKRYLELQFNFYSPILFNLNRVIRLKKIIKEIKPDILTLHSLWYPAYLGLYTGFQPFVISAFDGDIVWSKDNVSLWHKLRSHYALKHADLVVGDSQYIIEACIKKGSKRHRSYVMRRGVDLTKFNIYQNKETVRKQLRLPVDHKIVLSPRNLGASYNLEKIISIIPKIVKKIKNVLFVFIWHSSEEGKNLKSLAAKLGISESVRFVGRVEHGIVALYHRSSDVMISISDRDSGPVALQEAMACGNVPVISDLPCVRELVTDRVNGFLVNPSDETQVADAVITLLTNDTLRAEIAEWNWEIAQEKCDQEKEMQKMEELYYELTKENKK